MRTFILLFCTAAFSFSSGDLFSQDVKIEIKSDRTLTVDEVFEIIRTQTDYRFAYRSDAFIDAPEIEVKKGLINAHDLLVKSLAFGNLYYELAPNRTIVLKERNLSPLQEPITGVVIDENGLPMSGVTVSVQGINRGTLTDFDGGYRIIAEKGQKLVFNYLGKKVTTLLVGDSKVIDVVMEDSIEALEETIVVAYGTSKRQSLVGSVAVIKSEDFAERPVTNITNALVGTIPGLQTFATSGAPGSSPEIIIRGVGSARLNASSPLYVIDGFPYDVGAFSGVFDTTDATDPLAALDPDNIESVSVLKDASATALYGSRAANGVILITTKKGRGQKATFNLRLQEGVVTSAIPLDNSLNSKEYYELMWTGLRNRQVTAGFSEQDASQFATNNLINTLGYNIYDVPDDQLVGTDGVLNPNAQLLVNPNDLDWWASATPLAFRKNYGFDVSAGNQKSNYFASVGYTKEDGFVVGSSFERFNARLNLNSQATDWLNVGFNINASHNITLDSGADGNNASLLAFSRTIAPIYPVYLLDENGNRVLDASGNPEFDLGAQELDSNGQEIYPDAFGIRSGRRAFQAGVHPIRTAGLDDSKNTATVLSSRGFLEINFTKNLKLRTGVGVDLYNRQNRAFAFSRLPIDRNASRSYNVSRAITFNQLLTYDKSFGDHDFSVLLGHESFQRTSEYLFARQENQIFDGNIEFSNFDPEIVGTPETLDDRFTLDSNLDEFSLESYFTRLNYNFKNKYLASFSYRSDGSSILSEKNRWGEFYSVGLGWNISSESFMDNVKWIDFLKLRASIGTAGNTGGLSSYVSQATFKRGGNIVNPGYVPGTPGAPDLVWEGQETLDLGLEFNVLKNRISGTVEYYQKTSRDLIFNVPFAPSLGLPRPSFIDDTPVLSLNIGEIVNKGVEVQLQGDIIRAKDFTWNLNVNIATTDTEVTKLANGEPIDLGSRILTEGRQLFEWYRRNYVGVNPANGDPLYRGLREPRLYRENRDIIVGQDTLTPNRAVAQRHRTGKNSTPDLFGGITNTLRYKGFSLAALLSYQLGGYIIDQPSRTFLHPTAGSSASRDILNAWQKPGDITDIPRFDLGATHAGHVTGQSDRWLIKRDNMVLRRVTLNWRFPKNLVEKINMKAANIYVTGENLAFFSTKKGINGNVSGGQGLTRFTPGRIFSLGVNFKF
ncbi:SusC/RagA family TonB-linked outer membrane protein [Flavivirga abyssicola]|uniref:SusC/RagA family TonB-linked outer membrane protein n=1 Tax=Flavivirga abyssicola TaxID=3063533 RepID=UPI0026E0CDDB|nr:SusC/RagA family TonB-linked outer membrane protein [Flavivirga sp. MEBiC07777]WVK13811.1 SusC/RagA family TonB-linked outer membrane protein [Flavivirga sp. MEBiC07777]